MQVITFTTSPYDSNSYLINGKILIDTSTDTESLIGLIEKEIPLEQLELIILTHCHFDHTAGVPEIAKRSDAKIGIHRADAPYIGDDRRSVAYLFGSRAPDIHPDNLYEDGDIIILNDREALEVIHTPGHTEGGICLYEPYSKSLFSGDTIFSGGGVGRTDFEGGSARQLVESIGKIAELDVPQDGGIHVLKGTP
jgi:glyoxylase-like metal-dependent hydrolase (beta-lactamase superfamily II)